MSGIRSQALAQAEERGSIAVDIFQKLVAASRSADRTMARLSQWTLENQTRVRGPVDIRRRPGGPGQRDDGLPLLQAPGLGAVTRIFAMPWPRVAAWPSVLSSLSPVRRSTTSIP